MAQYRDHGVNLAPKKQQKDIMIVEDDIDLLEIYRVILEKDSWNVISTTTCKDACLKLLGAHPPDVMVLDLGLPDCDGIEILETIHNGGIQTHVVVVSGCGDIQKAVSCVHAGAVEFIEKPIEPEKFLRIINKYHNVPTAKRIATDRDFRAGPPQKYQEQTYPEALESKSVAPQHYLPQNQLDLSQNLLQKIESNVLSKSHFYAFIAFVLLVSLGVGYVSMEHLEDQSNRRTEALQKLLTQSVRSLEIGNEEIQKEIRAEGNKKLQTEKKMMAVQAINEYKKKKVLETPNDFKKFYLMYFSINYWHIKPEVFIQSLREARIPEKFIPGSSIHLIKMKRAHMRLLGRFIRHLKTTDYGDRVIPKKDRMLNSYRMSGDIDYGQISYAQKDKNRLIGQLEDLVATLQFGGAEEGIPNATLRIEEP